MKNILLTTLLMSFCVFISKAQDDIKNLPRIETTGFAEKEVIPDEIFVGITLREYYPDNKAKEKVSINSLEHKMKKAVKNAGIESKNLSVTNIFGYNYNNSSDSIERNLNFLARKQYTLKLNNPNSLDNIISSLDTKGIENVNINSYLHSKIDEYKKALKVQAIKSAKEKAEYLLSAIDCQIGMPLEIYDNETYYSGSAPMMMVMKNSNFTDDDASYSYNSDISFKKIKIRAEVRVVFAVKNKNESSKK